METSFTTNKKVYAFRGQRGTVSYVLFACRRDRNYFPDRMRWECCAFGTYAEVMRWVYVTACMACEANSHSHGRSHRLEMYLQEWASAFTTPLLMADRTIRLWVGNGPYDPVKPGDLATASMLLATFGRSDAYRVLEHSMLSFFLYDDTDVLRALFSHGRLSPRRIFPRLEPFETVDRSLAPDLAMNAVQMPAMQMFKIGSNDLVRIECGKFGSGLWQFLSLPQYLGDVAYRLEMTCPGMGSVALREFVRARLKAQCLPTDSRVGVFRRSMDSSLTQCAAADHMARVAGLVGSRQRAPAVAFYRYAEVVHFGLEPSLSSLAPRQLVWEIDCPSCGSAKVPDTSPYDDRLTTGI